MSETQSVSEHELRNLPKQISGFSEISSEISETQKPPKNKVASKHATRLWRVVFDIQTISNGWLSAYPKVNAIFPYLNQCGLMRRHLILQP